MTLAEKDYKTVNPNDELYNLAKIPDFNSLIAQSQKHHTPVFSLSDKQIEQSGKVLSTMKQNRDNFKDTFYKLAQTVISLTY